MWPPIKGPTMNPKLDAALNLPKTDDCLSLDAISASNDLVIL
jgi:hypothetical protein